MVHGVVQNNYGDMEFSYDVEGDFLELHDPFSGELLAQMTKDDLFQLLDAFRVESLKIESEGYYVSE